MRYCREWYGLNDTVDCTRVGHRSGLSLGRVTFNMTLGKAFENMRNRSNIRWTVGFNPSKPTALEKSNEVWNHIVESGLHLGKWTSLLSVPIRNDQFVLIGFETEASAICFKMLWPELYIRPNI